MIALSREGLPLVRPLELIAIKLAVAQPLKDLGHQKSQLKLRKLLSHLTLTPLKMIGLIP